MKCESVDCGFVAAYWCGWPEATPKKEPGIKFCELCMRRAKEIAKVMGFELPVVPLELWEAWRERDRQIQDAVDRLTGEKLPEPGQEGGL